MSTGVPLRLSETKPDFESIVLQLQLYVTTKGTWIDQQTSGTGQTILEAVSAVGAFNQFGIEMSFREAFIRTAQRDSSIYAGADFLGVHITRKTSAKVQVRLTRSKNVNLPIVIPRLSAFTIDGTSFFNRDPITFSAGSSTSDGANGEDFVYLYQGEIRSRSFSGRSSAFQEVTIGEQGFIVSDDDVYVYLVNTTKNERTLWSKTDDGLWIASTGELVYFDRTTGDGDVILTFGDGNHGAMPGIGYTIEVQYAVCDGSSANNGGSGLSISLASDSDIKGTTISAIVGGADEKPASFYRNLASSIYRARRRCVTESDYVALSADYPGVAAAVEKAQRDIAPGDLRWMNIVRVCLLPYDSDKFTDIEWDDFLSWMETRKHAAVQIQKYDPIVRTADVKLHLAMTQNAVPGVVYQAAYDAVVALFEKSIDSLGKRIAFSDIVEAARVDDVDYVQVLSPTSDLYIDPEVDDTAPYSWWKLQTLEITTSYSERKTLSARS